MINWLTLKRVYRGIVLVGAWAFLMHLGFWSYDHPNERTLGGLYVLVASTALVIGWARLWKEPTHAGPPATVRDVLTIPVVLLLSACGAAIGWLIALAKE